MFCDRFAKLAPEIVRLIDSCKKLVAYFREANLQSKLTDTLKHENATRWNSFLHCLIVIREMLMKVIDVLSGINKLSKVAVIERNLLNTFIAFLNQFGLAILVLEKFREPTKFTRFCAGVSIFFNTWNP